MSIQIYKELNKSIRFFYSKIFVYKELFALLITITIVKIENIELFLLGRYLKFTILVEV